LIQNILYNNLYIYKIKSILEPSGCIRSTFNNSLYWAGKSSFEEAIIGAVNDAIPQRWIDQLDFEVKIYLYKFINFVITYVQV